MQDVVFGTEGISIASEVHVFGGDLPRPSNVDLLLMTWRGFAHVVDDVGHRYLMQDEIIHTGPRADRSEGRLRKAFFPAVAADAEQLTFSSPPTTLRVEGMRLGAPPRITRVSMPGVAVGEVVWHVKIPRGSSYTRS